MITVKFECDNCGYTEEEDCLFLVNEEKQSIHVKCLKCGEEEVEYR